MDRLTERISSNVVVYAGKHKSHEDADVPAEVSPGGVREILHRLAAYEDTGLEPEEVTAIKHAFMGREIAKITEFDGIPIQRLQELAQAEKDGRLVVLREMDGEPVYLYFGGGGEWALVRLRQDEVYFSHKNGISAPSKIAFECGVKVYRHKPEEE